MNNVRAGSQNGARHGIGLSGTIPATTNADRSSVSEPGLDLSFSRIFPETISGRYAIGTLGRGWSVEQR